MRVFGYVRVSTAEQASSGMSLEAQQNQVRGYAMIKGWEISDIFIEAGVSGSTPFAERPEGQRLLATVKSGDAIVTPKLDRAFRSASDALGTLEELKADGVALHMIDLGGDVCGNGISKLVFTILSAVAENERERIRERIRDVKRDAAARGMYNGGKVPFGWTLLGRRLIKNEDEQRVISTMLGMKERGVGLREISRAVGKEATTVKRILDRDAQMRVTRRAEAVERMAARASAGRAA